MHVPTDPPGGFMIFHMSKLSCKGPKPRIGAHISGNPCFEIGAQAPKEAYFDRKRGHIWAYWGIGKRQKAQRLAGHLVFPACTSGHFARRERSGDHFLTQRRDARCWWSAVVKLSEQTWSWDSFGAFQRSGFASGARGLFILRTSQFGSAAKCVTTS